MYHDNGQVEIDALVSTRRAGKRVLLVIEAKSGPKRQLAKHKLGYPALAAASLSLPVDEIVPVYLRARAAENGIRYSIYECSALSGDPDQPVLTAIDVTDSTHYLLDVG